MKKDLDITPFFRMAKSECCNYNSQGPLGMRDYCQLEPTQSNFLCLMTLGLPCKWFVEAVLPLSIEHEETWREEIDEPTKAGNRTCSCGKRFKPGSNRQAFCSKCSNSRKTLHGRERKRRSRGQEGGRKGVKVSRVRGV